jgi:hypothetical protein
MKLLKNRHDEGASPVGMYANKCGGFAFAVTGQRVALPAGAKGARHRRATRPTAPPKRATVARWATIYGSLVATPYHAAGTGHQQQRRGATL